MSWGGRFPVTYTDCEDAAEHVLRLLGLHVLDRVDPGALAGVLGAEALPGAPRGCRGIGLLAPPVRLYDDGDPETLPHELMHLALESWGLPPIHHPDKLVSIGSAALEMPRMGVRRAIAEFGLSAWHLLGRYSGIRPSRIFVRAALVHGAVAVFHRPRGAPTRYVPDVAEPPAVLPLERDLVETARARRAPALAKGIGAWPCSDSPDGSHPYIVVLAEERAWWPAKDAGGFGK